MKTKYIFIVKEMFLLIKYISSDASLQQKVNI